ncbi:EamA family transporter [Pollutimonas thiosulfatoxidans]|uniref:O-acetylserine/cysteine exporter n=1 Tax=Pollutimonas thiosulfatoxidans TaxID=2028345 RepID=A0A410GF57_9BURK|nr:EamA family transporter [Pollutimonas thiosulfatoxidans]MBF6617188.1 EamA family transporter [Candidimonas sp.]QAA94885.1 O-acetylserine/cysteine exporter [Pollutimonas thiosulfatoxidans]
MPLKDWLAALVVITAWGMNFVVIKVGLDEIPPLLLGALRFTLVAFPAVFFIKRPALPWRIIVLYGLTISLGQFVFLFTAMSVGMPAGLASLVLQSQAFFTVLIAALLLGEGVRRHNVLGMLVAVAGLVLIHQGADVRTMSMLGFVLTLFAALSWAMGNIVAKTAGRQIDMVGLVIWGALIPPIPFLVLSWFLEGPDLMLASLAGISYVGVGAVIYLALVATIVGYVLWGRLLTHHPASKVAPLSLLVPIIGLVSSAVLLDERLAAVQWVGGLIVMAGLVINVFGARALALMRSASRP